MQLSDFMAERGLTDNALAAEVGRDRTSVMRWRTRKTKPDFDALVAIERLSNGMVTASDFAEAAQ